MLPAGQQKHHFVGGTEKQRYSREPSLLPEIAFRSAKEHMRKQIGTKHPGDFIGIEKKDEGLREPGPGSAMQVHGEGIWREGADMEPGAGMRECFQWG